MSRNNVIVIVVAVILIILCIMVGTNNNTETGIVKEENGQEKSQEVAFNTVTNEVTGAEEYVVYNKETGEEITRVQEEHQLKIYEIDPTYEELPIDFEEAIQNVDNTIIE